jgi:hypothetical protein
VSAPNSYLLKSKKPQAPINAFKALKMRSDPSPHKIPINIAARQLRLERPGEAVERIALFGRALFLAVKEFQKGAGRKDANIAMLFEGEQIGVAGDDAIRASRQGGGQHPIIIRIATNRRGKFCGFDGFRPFGEHGQQRHFIRGKIKFDAQLFPQFAKQNFRGDDGVGPQPHADEIAAHAVGHHGGNQNIGVEDEPHEMILKTSSSV